MVGARPYRAPLLSPLQALQSLFLGLLALSEIMNQPAAQTAFVATLLVVSVIQTVITMVVALIEFRLRRAVTSDSAFTSLERGS
jgi:hypothetical protein